jgi:uncharacterized protein YbjT (DUF2867 family)
VGRALVQALQARGADFETLSSRGEPALPGAPVRQARLDDEAGLRAAFAGIDTLFVLLPLLPQKLDWARNVARAAGAAGVRHLVRSSGAGADATSPYALPRLQGQIDEALRASLVPLTVLQPSGFMQNYLTMQRAALRDGLLRVATADQPQSLIDARDIAEAAAVVLSNPAPYAGKSFLLTGPEALTDTERAALISRQTGKPLRVQLQTPAEARAQMQQWGLPPALVEWLDSLNEIVSTGQAATVSEALPQLVGRPARRFEAFAAEHAADLA